MNRYTGMFSRLRIVGVLSIWTSLSLFSGLSGIVRADGTFGDYAAVPPVLQPEDGKPNVLVIIDNSNSMDEDATGAAVGSDNPGSKSEIARGAIKNLITDFTGKLRMGLMAYQQSGVSSYWLDNSPYDLSYDPANYDPSFTGPRDSTTKRFRLLRPGSTTEYMYYNVALPYYHPSNSAGLFCYSNTADASNDFVESGVCTTSGGADCDTYYCWYNKIGTSDTLPSPLTTASQGFSSYEGSHVFNPTDSDVAQGISDFGTHIASIPVGQTWFSNSSPGRGYLHVPIAELDAAQATLLNNKLATSQFATVTDTPLRNAGLTPLEGTLATANDYFSGNLSETDEGGDQPAPPASTCGGNDYVILITDGLPSTDADGNDITDTAAALTATADEAENLLDNNVNTYVIGFAMPYGTNPAQLDVIAAAGGTGTAYSANDTTSLNAALTAIFNDILNRTSAGTGAAVVANSNSGVGAFYQALYTPSLSLKNPAEADNRDVSWVGRLHSVFVDDYGYLREDSNQNDKLDNYSTDYIIDIFYNENAQDESGQPLSPRVQVRRYSSTSATAPTGLAYSGSPYSIEKLKAIWDAREGLDSVTDYTTQRTYTALATSGRYIVTNIPGTTTLIDFTATQFPDTPATNNRFRYLGGVPQAEAPDLINYIRGFECEDLAVAARPACYAEYRNRTIDWDGDSTNERWLLGDIIHSTPVAVGLPHEDYFLKYGDTTYDAFRTYYKDRRNVIYVGGNDGMLHAFNGGFWDETDKAFKTSDPTPASRPAHPLGTELWAYVPGNLLPHLQWLKDPEYAHAYYVDGVPKVFDVNIFADDSDHPGGWGTILVVGMRFGGGPFSIDTDGDAVNDAVTRSAFAIFDITNPENPPTLLAELSDSDMGFTTSVPQLIKKRVPDTGSDWANPTENDWKLVFTSGPHNLADASSSTHAASFYLYDLGSATTTKVSTGVIGFGGDVTVADWDGDFIDDVVYSGVITGTPATQGGRVVRLDLTDNSVTTLLNPGSPFTAAPNVIYDASVGLHWIHMGSGRLYTAGDNSTTDQQAFYGLKEPLDTSQDFTFSTLTVAGLSNHTNVKVYQDSSILPDPTAIGSYSASSYYDVLNAMLSDPASGVNGWYNQFEANGTDPSRRSITAATQVSKLLLYTDYKPSDDVCSPEGTSRLNVVDFRTGTSIPYGPLGHDPGDTNNGAELAPVYIDLGQGIASSPVVHAGSGNTDNSVTVFTQKSTGEVLRTKVFLQPASGGRQSWRELYLE